MSSSRTTAIILASGSGLRVGGEVPKQFVSIQGHPVIWYSLNAFQQHPDIKQIILVIHPDFISTLSQWIDLSSFSKVAAVVSGGATRQESSFIGLQTAKSFGPDFVLIHDAARPCFSSDLIDRILLALNTSIAVSPVLDVPDTLYQVDEDGSFVEVLNRNSVKRVQTPQGFDYQAIMTAYDRARVDGKSDFSDDVSVIAYYHLGQIQCVEGESRNMKITLPSDLPLIEESLRHETKI